jgi:hypothetical protein
MDVKLLADLPPTMVLLYPYHDLWYSLLRSVREGAFLMARSDLRPFYSKRAQKTYPDEEDQ